MTTAPQTVSCCCYYWYYNIVILPTVFLWYILVIDIVSSWFPLVCSFVWLFRPRDDDMSKGFNKHWCAYFVRPSPRQTMQRPPIQCIPNLQSYVTILRSTDIALYPSPNIFRGSKSAICGPIAWRVSNLSRCRSEMEWDVCTIFLKFGM